MTHPRHPRSATGKTSAKDGSIGSAGRDAKIIHAETYIDYGGTNKEETDFVDEDKEEEPEERSGIHPLIIIAAVILSPCLLLAFCAESNPQAQASPFPTENGIRPSGATDPAVLNAAIEALNSCAKSPVLDPDNCPPALRWI